MKEKQKYSFTTEVGDFLIVYVVGVPQIFIAEVTQSSPLRMKIHEKGGLYDDLGHDAVMISDWRTEQFQRDVIEDTNTFLEEQAEKGLKIASGLESLGVTDNTLQSILPAAVSS